MRRLLTCGFVLAAAAIGVLGWQKPARGQEQPKKSEAPVAENVARQAAIYRLEFIVREVEEGKRLNSRSYVMSVEDGDEGSVHVGNRVPYSTGKEQFQYFDVGVSIRCRLHERDGYVVLERGDVEISSIVKDESTAPGTLNPVVRRANAGFEAAATPGKATLVTTLDDVSSDHRYEVEVTATKVK